MKLLAMRSQFFTFVWKEFLHVMRDRKTLLMLFGLPISQIILFGFALTNEIKNSRLLISDFAKDAASQQLIGKFEAGSQFIVLEQQANPEDIEAAFKAGDIDLAVIIPSGFYNDLLHLNHAQVQILTDASNPNTASTVSGYAASIIAGYNAELAADSMLPYPVNAEVRMIYNPEMKSAVNFVPGIIALILLLICILMTSVSIVKEKESGTMEVLLVSPFNPFLVIISKAIPYLLLSIINLSVILLLSVYTLGLPIHGSITLLYLISIIFIVASLSLGLIISNLTSTQQTAMLVALLGLLVPSMLFIGFMFPIENMPVPLQLFSNIVPAKWYYIIIKSIMVKGLGLSAILKETAILAGMTVVLLGINFSIFKTRLS